MATIAEIAKNPSRPIGIIDAMLRRGMSNSDIAVAVNAKMATTKRKFKPLTAANVDFYRKRSEPLTARTVNYTTKKGVKKSRSLSVDQILSMRAASKKRNQAQRYATEENFDTVFAKGKGGGGPRKSITAEQRETKQAMVDLINVLRSLKLKLGHKRVNVYQTKLNQLEKALALPTVGFQVGQYANKRRNVGGMVVENPSFKNPSFDFSKETVVANLVSGGQTAVGVVFGVAAAKFGNDLIVEKIMQTVFKKVPGDKVSIWQRIATAAITGIVVPGVVRAMLPGKEWVDRVADGMVSGSALYVLGGIEYQGKPFINIGQMVGAEDDVVVDSSVSARAEQYVLDAPVQASTETYQLDNSVETYDQNEDPQYVATNDSLQDDMISGNYDATENPELQ